MKNLTTASLVDPETWATDVPNEGVKLYVLGQPGDADAVDVVTLAQPGWAMRIRLVPSGAESQVVDIQLRALDQAAGPPGSKLLRSLGYGAVVDAAEAALREPLTAWSMLGPQWPGPVKRPGRKGKSDLEFIPMAKRYVDALEVAPRSPIKQIVTDLAAAGEHATDHEVSSQVNEAKNRGLLTRGRSGVAGGEWTDKGRRLLAQLGMED